MENDKDLIIKLFDQVKSSSDKTDAKIDVLSSVVKDLIISASKPSHSDISNDIQRLDDSLDSFDRGSLDRSRDIVDCKDAIKSIGENILTLLKKVNVMIIVVLVTFTIMALSYLFVSDSIRHMVRDEINQSYILKPNNRSSLSMENMDKDYETTETPQQ